MGIFYVSRRGIIRTRFGNTNFIYNLLFLKFCEPQNLENRDFSRRKLSVIRGIAISDNEEKAFFQDFEAGSDSTPTANNHTNCEL